MIIARLPSRHRFSKLGITQYEKIVKSVEQLFEAKGYDKYILDPYRLMYGTEDEMFWYLTKYGDEIPWGDQRKLWKINVTPAEIGETNPTVSEYGIVVWEVTDNISKTFSFNPVHMDIQHGIDVPEAMAGGKRRKTRRLRRARRSRRARSRRSA